MEWCAFKVRVVVGEAYLLCTAHDLSFNVHIATNRREFVNNILSKQKMLYYPRCTYTVSIGCN